MKREKELISAFLNWYNSDSISTEEDYYQDTVTEGYLNGLDQEAFIQFFFQFAREGGKVQTGGERTAGRLRKNIEENYEEFRARAMEPFQEDFDLETWFKWVNKFTFFGKGLATIYLNRVDKNRFVIVNDRSVDAYQKLGFGVRKGKLLKTYRDLEKAQKELLEQYPEMDNFYKLDALSQYLIGTKEGENWLKKIETKEPDIGILQPYLKPYKNFIQSEDYDEW
ncbi:MAG TPA: hypothetical protein VJ939_00820, partial [Bacteroidales bacterium]|nr:hypothetical protein [Bacteroidales bacterium]